MTDAPITFEVTSTPAATARCFIWSLFLSAVSSRVPVIEDRASASEPSTSLIFIEVMLSAACRAPSRAASRAAARGPSVKNAARTQPTPNQTAAANTATTTITARTVRTRSPMRGNRPARGASAADRSASADISDTGGGTSVMLSELTATP
ncbi:hypothetical protein [Nocardia terpenica]|uniref:hypothetical protein n=1 Tax=Nocardia terpenica TaxID=455432 RepID=UPI0012E970EC|nr:hypothetical protein [Nocardia terpenica]